SLAFKPQGKLSGSTGCNTFTGTYTLNKLTFTLNLDAITRKACPTATLAAQDSAITKQLPMTSNANVSGEVLTLSRADGTKLFTYKALSTSLIGTTWAVTAVNDGKGGAAGTSRADKLTASFGKDRKFTGFGGCNQLTGPFQLGGINGIKIGPLVSTKKS